MRSEGAKRRKFLKMLYNLEEIKVVVANYVDPIFSPTFDRFAEDDRDKIVKCLEHDIRLKTRYPHDIMVQNPQAPMWPGLSPYQSLLELQRSLRVLITPTVTLSSGHEVKVRYSITDHAVPIFGLYGYIIYVMIKGYTWYLPGK